MRRTGFSLAVLLGLLLSLLSSPSSPAVAQGPVVSAELNKSFTPVSITAGQVSRLRVAIFNSNPFELTNAAWSDNLVSVQPGLRLADPLNINNSCEGTVTAVPGGTTLSLSGGRVPGLSGVTVGSCYVEVDVTSTTAGNLVNTIPAGNLTARGNNMDVTSITPASATLRVGVVQPPTVSKGFNPSTVYVGQTSQLTVTIRNNDLVTALTNVSLTDVMPANVVIAPTPGISISGCGAGTPVTAIAGSNSLIYSGGGIAANATCTIRVNVVSSTPNAYVNDIPAGSLTNTQGVTNALASAQFNVQAIGIAKAFSPTGIQAGGSSTLTITLRNPTGTPYTNARVSDTLPIAPNNFLEYVPGSAATTCGGAASITGRTLNLAGGTVPAGTIAAPGSCTVTAQVTIPAGVSTATYANTIAVGAFSASSAGSPVSNYNASSANLYVYVSGGGLSGSKAFATNPIFVGNNTRMRISLTAPADTALTNFSVTDTLPAGLVITNSTPATRANCGAASVLTAPTGGNIITLTNGSISAGFTCTIDVYVTATAPGSYTNSISPANINNDENRRPTANIINTTPLYVRALSGLTMGKVFYPNAINPNTVSALTITLTNTNAEPLTNVSLTDTLPITNASNGIFVAPTPNASTTCAGGTVTATAGSNTITLAGGSIPAQVSAVPGICTITVDVIGRGSAGARTNTIPATNVSATLPSLGVINAQADASATITIASLSIGVVKNFTPLTIYGGSASTLSVQLSNPNNAQLVGIAFTDNMPAGMIIANPPNLNTGTCGGVLTGTPGSSSFSFSGGSLNAAQSCTVSLSVTMTVNYNLTNVIPINAVTTANGARNPAAAQVSLNNLPGASVSKVFAPNPVLAGLENFSLLTITIQNTGNATISNVGLVDTLPEGLVIAPAPAPDPVNNCGGTLTATRGTRDIRLTNGSLDGSSHCTLVIAVSGATPGSYMNTIPAGALTNDQNATNSEPAEDILVLTANPALNITKTAVNPIPTRAGNDVLYNIVVENTGNVPLTNVTVTDPAATVGACTPAQPATLPVGASIICPAAHTLTQAEIDAGAFTNTATADSSETPADTDDETVTITPQAVITLEKTGTLNPGVVAPADRADPGDTITYTFRVENTGNVTIRDISLADTVGGVTVSGGPVTLAPGQVDSSSFTATYSLTQSDIDAGTFTNLATASGQSPSGDRVTDTDDDTQDLPQSPALALVKTVTSAGPYVAGTDITYSLVATNTGNVSLTGVNISDPGATIGTCTPAQPADLAPGATLTCPASHTLTQVEVNSGAFQNTATTGSDQTGPDADSDTQTVDIPPLPALTLEKTGTLHLDIVAPDDEPNPGDTITYTFTVTNTGNVTLTGVDVTDAVSTVTVSGGPITLEPGESDSTSFTATYTLTQDDINAGAFDNSATASGQPPTGSPATDNDDDTQTLPSAPALGVAKRVLGSPEGISPGVWRVIYAIELRNYGNVPLSALQVNDDLADTFPAGTIFSVLDVRGTGVTINTAFNGTTDLRLLAGTDVLDVNASASIELELRLIPAESGPFHNSAIASGDSPSGDTSSDTSQDGSDPDPDGDGDPTNNNDPTPLSFGPNLFDPPAGVKTVDAKRLPVLRWTVIWINNSNVVAVDAVSSDPIPAGTKFVDDGIPSGYPLPGGALPAGSTASGVACTDTSASTSTTYCYYEGPTTEYPRGRVVWQGTLGPDLGAGTPETALNEITIVFAVRANTSAERVNNTATIDSDRNGDGDVEDPGETHTATASATWRRRVELPEALPDTGFAPGRVTRLPQQPAALAYTPSDLTLEIPALNLKASIVSVPLTDQGWQLEWLGAQVGYLEGTAFPTWNGNSALTAHVYDANGRPGPFVNLGSLRWGSQVMVHAFGRTYIYEVRSVRAQVDAKEANVIRHEEQPWLTLITCQGYDEKSDSYRWRTVVRAVLVKVE